jgi:hypothetical protein
MPTSLAGGWWAPAARENPFAGTRRRWDDDAVAEIPSAGDRSARLAALCWDAHDPAGLARFWAAALRWDVAADGHTLVPTDHTGFGIRFLPGAEAKAGASRIHLDLTTTSLEDQDDTVTQLLGLGARHLDIGQDPDDGHLVLADPEGNEFCVIEPTNVFLGDCERLGAVNCDGSQEVGYFWSEALGWPLVWDQDEETAIRAPSGTGPIMSWGGPPVAPKKGRNRLHLDVAPAEGDDPQAEVERLVSLGARRTDVDDGDRWVLLDPDDNEFCVVSP